MEAIASDSFDVVVCEQVLEHLQNPQTAMRELARVTRPGGILVIGVPSFPLGFHHVKRHIIPVTDRIFRIKKVRGHIQAWSKRAFLGELRKQCPEIEILVCRGFRIVSGGVIGPFEFLRWWWRVNRIVGRCLPSLCVEIQVLAVKKK
jgi:ubiquinone/menaquinone biosynthesis C-methylase UbiE